MVSISQLRKLLAAAPAGLLALLLAGSAPADPPQARPDLKEPVYRVAKTSETPGAKTPLEELTHTNPGEHPLAPSIRMAVRGLGEIDGKIKDYSATLVKREEVDGKLGVHEYIFVKVRHQPFSVYMYFLGPAEMKGRECIYVDGANKNQLVVHDAPHTIKGKLGTFHIDPNGRLAMADQRYPITQVGIRTLTARLIEVAEADSKFGECDVKVFKGAKVNGRACTNIRVTHPVQRANFTFNIAEIFIDDELQIPIRYSSSAWPKAAGESPSLIEEYTYLNLKPNIGLTDKDFDENNPEYRFH